MNRTGMSQEQSRDAKSPDGFITTEESLQYLIRHADKMGIISLIEFPPFLVEASLVFRPFCEKIPHTFPLECNGIPPRCLNTSCIFGKWEFNQALP